MAERAEELREQLDAQRADITRTVEQIENRVVPGRILERRKYRMRRSLTDFRDRLMGNDESEYPQHWYAQPAAPLGPEYGGGQTPTQYSTEYSFGEESGGGRMDGARETMGNVGGHATDAAHGVADRASGAAQGVAGAATGAVQGVSSAVTSAPSVVRRQTQGSPLAMGALAFGAGVVAAALLPETQKEKQLARQATPQLQSAVEGAKSLGADMAESMKEPVQDSVQQLKDTATSEAQALKDDATSEAQAAKSDVQATVKE